MQEQYSTEIFYKSLLKKALSLLAKREYNQAMMQEKLGIFVTKQQEKFSAHVAKQMREDADQCIEHAIKWLIEQNYINEYRYAELIIQGLESRYGRRYINHYLKQKQFNSKVIAKFNATYNYQLGLEQAYIVWQKKFDKKASNLKEKAKQSQFLNSRGFDFDIIKQVLGDNLEDYFCE